MNKQKNIQMVIIAILSVCIVTMSIGFSEYTRSLNINGTAKIENAAWKVQFKEDTYKEKTGVEFVSAKSHTLSGTDLSFDINLRIDKAYEFDVIIENAGTLDATLSSITMSQLTEEQKEYLTYEITYEGSLYTETTTDINKALNKNETATVHVKVEYKLKNATSKIPENDENINLTAAFNFNQA